MGHCTAPFFGELGPRPLSPEQLGRDLCQTPETEDLLSYRTSHCYAEGSAGSGLCARTEAHRQGDCNTNFGDWDIHDVLTTLALGHALEGSESPFAGLSVDLISNCIAPAVSKEYWKVRSEAGLLTPPRTGHGRRTCTRTPDSGQPPSVKRRRLTLLEDIKKDGEAAQDSHCREEEQCPAQALDLSVGFWTPLKYPKTVFRKSQGSSPRNVVESWILKPSLATPGYL